LTTAATQLVGLVVFIAAIPVALTWQVAVATALIKRGLVYHAYEKLKGDKCRNRKKDVLAGVGLPSALYQNRYFTI